MGNNPFRINLSFAFSSDALVFRSKHSHTGSYRNYAAKDGLDVLALLSRSYDLYCRGFLSFIQLGQNNQSGYSGFIYPSEFISFHRRLDCR